uniref:Galactose oxidase n=1 Tax=Pyricularia oryzae (strain 70-15 / ATCC MYA-4617 / FGSC 8958) TaxID=242507 RepID=Q2KGY0_PYRO7|nr:hypothetical protein MGCH7_ch7g205 [Pyricularia oryzae 70-15]
MHHPYTRLVFCAILVGTCLAQKDITQCPTAETTIQDSQGRPWAICPNSDFDGDSLQILANVTTDQACQERCASNGACFKAVFDKTHSYCHLKDNGQKWVTSDNSQFNSIRVLDAIPDKQPIDRCPGPETNTTDSRGRTWTICQNSDFWGPTIEIIPNVASSAACQQLCAANSVCNRAVWDRSGYCSTKGAGQAWMSSANKFDTVRLASDASGSGGGGIITTSDGSTWAQCTDTDWQGRSVYALGDFKSAAACAEACSLTPICTDAVWDKQYNYCHMKDSNQGLTQSDNKQYDQLRLIKKAPPVSQAAQNGGRWSDKISYPIVPAAAYVVPEQPYASRVLAFSAADNMAFAGRNGQTQFTDWNYQTGDVSHRTVQETKHDMFCPGISTLADGKMVVTGGDDAAAVSIYDPATNKFVRAPDMKVARGYQSSATLSTGKVFTIGGSFTGGVFSKNGERGAADTPGNWQCEASAQHPDGEVFSPPYLFNADGSEAARPNITALSTSSDAGGNWVQPGGTLTVTMDGSGPMTFAVLRLGSATHSINTDQRRLSLTAKQKGSTHTITLPSDSGVLLPGYWFLFAMNDKGTPYQGVRDLDDNVITMEPTQGARVLMSLVEIIQKKQLQEADYSDTIREQFTICYSECANEKILEKSSKDLLSRAGLPGHKNSDHNTYMVTVHTNATKGEENIMLCLEALFSIIDGWIVINHVNTSTEFSEQDDRANVPTAALFGYVWSKLASKKSNGRNVSPLRAVVFEKLSNYFAPDALSMLRFLSDTRGALLNTLNLSSGQDFLGKLNGPVKFEDLFKDGGVCRVLSDALTATQSVFPNRYPTEVLWEKSTTTGYSLLALLQPLLDLEQSPSASKATYQNVPVRAPVFNRPRIINKSYEALVDTASECSESEDPGSQSLSLRGGGDLDREQPPRRTRSWRQGSRDWRSVVGNRLASGKKRPKR